MTGRGEMLADDQATHTRHKSIDVDKHPVASLATESGKGIPLIPIEAMAGALTGEQSVLEYECERYVVPMFKGADFLIPVKGSSMYPKYSSGDIVACQCVPMSDLFSNGIKYMSLIPIKGHSSSASNLEVMKSMY